MIKIAISGKANSGKNTAASLILSNLKKEIIDFKKSKTLAFADPIKEMLRVMYPNIQKKHLYGSSKYRDNIIENAQDEDGKPLTIRKGLLDLGTQGRKYNANLWIDIFEHRFNKFKDSCDAIISNDVRFRNEFDFLKKRSFYLIRVIRNDQNRIDHISEVGQDQILDREFDLVIDNNNKLSYLKKTIKETVIPQILEYFK